MVRRGILMVAVMALAATCGAVGLRDLIARISAAGGAAALGGAVDLNGSDEYFTESLSASNVMFGATSLTYSVWAFAKASGANDGLICLRPNITGSGLNGIAHGNTDNSQNLIYFHNGGAYASSANNFTTGAWHHVVVTWVISNAASMYIDGIPSTVGATSPKTAVGQGVATLGADRAAAGRVFYGVLDDVAIFKDRALASNEVAEIYNSGVGKPVTSLSTGTNGLVRYWKLDDGLTDPNASNALDSVSGGYATGTSVGLGDWTNGIIPLIGRP